MAESLYCDTNDPYLYLRFDQRGDSSFVIIGGEDHKTGQAENTEARYQTLAKILKTTFPTARLKHRWSGQVVETTDGLPYIGQVGEGQYLATGFSGNGITLGTFSAMLIRDLITGKSNPWTGLFSPNRKSVSGTGDYVRENKDFLAYFVKDWLEPSSPLEKLSVILVGYSKSKVKSVRFTATQMESTPCSRQFVRTWVVLLHGMMPKRHGTVPVTVRVSLPRENSSLVPQSPISQRNRYENRVRLCEFLFLAPAAHYALGDENVVIDH